MALLDGLLRGHTANKVSTSLHRRGITIRHIAFTLAFSVALWTLYYNYLRRSATLFPQEEVIFWPPETPEIWAHRAAQVKNAFLHAYHGYERLAFPHDELRPISNGSINNFNGWGVTAVDSLDTMLLMGLEDEYKRALPIIQSANFSLPTNTRVPFFETVIRYLGGLLSAYALSKDNLMRDKADELASKLSPAFNTSSGFPLFSVDTYNGFGTKSHSGILAEIATCQMEYAYLGKITGKKEHVDRATTITNLFYKADLSLSGGMYPTRWDLDEGKSSDLHLSVGASADSAHEYTIKQFLMTGKTDRANLEMYLRFTSHVINNLLYLSPQRNLLYVTDSSTHGNSTATSHSFEHLSCFFPGLLALGVHTLPLDHLETVGINITELADDLLPKHLQGYEELAEFSLANLHLWAAEGIAQTCYLTYADQPSGLGPDTVAMRVGGKFGETRWMDAMRKWKKSGHLGSPPGVADRRPWVGNPNATTAREREIDAIGRDYGIRNMGYYLRPETVESFYILWRTTGDVKWRHRGWNVFQAIERVARTPSGYASVDRVNSATPILQDSMPSYFLAETLKYLYLLFLEDDIVPLEKWVFNTEAHPLPVFEWSQREKEEYGIV
ncbi:glycoside hydrolase family 47 protein [Hydnomerulius pinastri MD-312]|uniref:alpha-1,2-Mannosidase n=1 Tax=Hydnomerulius pinastri MD-312 TaxID=994086 RepID=A0A0C9VNL4_9AGAM|nr:glycoside hydrolase family 47 protein [Hydnomerulius pinastri MD-312]